MDKFHQIILCDKLDFYLCQICSFGFHCTSTCIGIFVWLCPQLVDYLLKYFTQYSVVTFQILIFTKLVVQFQHLHLQEFQFGSVPNQSTTCYLYTDMLVKLVMMMPSKFSSDFVLKTFINFQVNTPTKLLIRKTACECLWEMELSYPVRA